MDIDTDESETIDSNRNLSTETNDDPWVDDEDRIANYFITANPDYHYVPLPQYIKIKNPTPGEVPIFEKRSFPKAARIHKKREDCDLQRFDEAMITTLLDHNLSVNILQVGFLKQQDIFFPSSNN